MRSQTVEQIRHQSNVLKDSIWLNIVRKAKLIDTNVVPVYLEKHSRVGMIPELFIVVGENKYSKNGKVFRYHLVDLRKDRMRNHTESYVATVLKNKMVQSFMETVTKKGKNLTSEALIGDIILYKAIRYRVIDKKTKYGKTTLLLEDLETLSREQIQDNEIFMYL